MHRNARVFQFALSCLLIAGCGPTAADRADRAAGELINLVGAMRPQVIGNQGRVPDRMDELVPTAQRVRDARARLTPDEKRAFDAKWGIRFQDAGLDQSTVELNSLLPVQAR